MKIIAKIAMPVAVTVLLAWAAAFCVRSLIFLTPVAFVVGMIFVAPALPLRLVGLPNGMMWIVGSAIWGVVIGSALSRLKEQTLKKVVPRMAKLSLFVMGVGFLLIPLDCRFSGRLCETHTFPGTRRPKVEIRSEGFVDAYYYAYVDHPLYKKKLLLLPVGNAYLKGSTSDEPWGEGEVRLAPSRWKQMYGVHWSLDGKRMAVTYGGWFVAAYDFRSGKKIEWLGSSYRMAETHQEIGRFINAE